MDHVIPQLLMLLAVLAVGLLAGAVLVIYLLTLLRLAVREQHRNVAWRREGVPRAEIRASQLTQSMASSTDAARKPKVRVSGR